MSVSIVVDYICFQVLQRVGNESSTSLLFLFDIVLLGSALLLSSRELVNIQLVRI